MKKPSTKNTAKKKAMPWDSDDFDSRDFKGKKGLKPTKRVRRQDISIDEDEY